ncbi:MAG: hypothetical protein WC686_00310 [Candidatus Shapirobacteria bacterium]|jgi:hypothetical protein
MKSFLKALLLAFLAYAVIFGFLGFVSILIPSPYFSYALTASASFSILVAVIIFVSIHWHQIPALLFILLLGVITAYFPLGYPMSEDPHTCQSFPCTNFRPDLQKSYFLVRGVPLIWQGYASFPLESKIRITPAPYSDFGRYGGDWWAPAAYWPNLVNNILIIIYPSALFYLLKILLPRFRS